MKFTEVEQVPIGDVFGYLAGESVAFYHRCESPEGRGKEFVHAFKLGERDWGSGHKPYAFPKGTKVFT